MPRLIYTLYIWLFFVPVMIVATAMFGLVCLISAPFIGARKAGELYAAPWARTGLALSGVSVSVSGRDHIQPGQSYVVVANHLSLFDIWVLYGYLGMDIRWVAKQEVRRIPILGQACVTLGHIFIDRSHPDRAVASLKAASKQVCGGTSIIFFPEGTRSRDGQLREFKKGAFRMAADLTLPVLPVTLSGTHEILPSDSARVTPGQAHITIHPALAPCGTSDDAVQQLMWQSRERIATGLPHRNAITAQP